MKLKRLIIFIILCLFGTLSAIAFVSSNMFDVSYFEYAYFEIDKIWLHIFLMLLLTFTLAYIAPRIHMTHPRRALWVLLSLSLIYTTGISVCWAWACHYVPVWDPGILCDIAWSLTDGQTLTADQFTYMAKYPHQLGLVLLFHLILRFFGKGGSSFMTLHYFMAACIPLILLAGYRLCRLLFDNSRACCYYLLLYCGCLPLFLYVNFIYSDIPGILLILLALDGLFAYQKHGWALYGCMGLFCLILATIIRKNSLVIVIAVSAIWLLNALYSRSRRLFIEALAIPAVVMLSSALFVSGACRHYQVPSGKASPAVVWIAMGMQESRFGCGWFNGYIDNQYIKLQGDPELLKQEAAADIRNSLSEFASHPGQAVNFYLHKTLIQWNQPSYQCLGLSKTYEEMPNRIVDNIYFGKINYYLRIYFDCYQLLVYMGITIYLANIFVSMKRQDLSMYVLIPLLAIFGGFLFSLLWEAKSRYIMPYFILMLPYAAEGIRRWEGIACAMRKRAKHEKDNSKPV